MRDSSVGNTLQYLTLEAPCDSWPSLSALHRVRYASPDAVVLSLLTDDNCTTSAQTGCLNESCGSDTCRTLSRIGWLMMLRCRWTQPAPLCWSVTVANPLVPDGARVTLRVLRSVPDVSERHSRDRSSAPWRVEEGVTTVEVRTKARGEDPHRHQSMDVPSDTALNAQNAVQCLQALWEQLRGRGRKSPACCSALLHGPHGSGKTRVIREWLASHSHDAPAPFVVHVNAVFESADNTTDAACIFRDLLSGGNSTPLRGGALTPRIVVFDHVDLLHADADQSFVLVAIHTIAQLLEDRRCWSPSRTLVNELPLLVVGLATDLAAVHPLLLSRAALGQHCIALACPRRGVGTATSTSAGSSSADGGERRWHRLFGMNDIKERMDRFLLSPLFRQAELLRAGVSVPKGALIVGPSGSGKTAVLAALCDELRGRPCAGPPLHVMLVDSLTLITKEVGESEKNIQRILDEARAAAPSVLFLDNLDAIAPPREAVASSSETNVTADRTLSTLLVELDGVRRKEPILIVASARSTASLDAAVLRPGRLDVHIHLPLPTNEDLARFVVERLGEEFLKTCGTDAATAHKDVEELLWKSVGSMGCRWKLTYAHALEIVRFIVLEHVVDKQFVLPQWAQVFLTISTALHQVMVGVASTIGDAV